MSTPDKSQHTTLPPLRTSSVFELLQSGCSGWNIRTFWDCYSDYLVSHGVILYKLDTRSSQSVWAMPDIPNRLHALATFPHLPTGVHSERDLHYLKGHLAPARDMNDRELMVKLIDNDSDEFSINTFLLDSEELRDSRTFPCVLPPLKIISTPHNFSFLVMPRWKEFLWSEPIPNVGEALNLVTCLLKGLAYLHEHRIVHRDISDSNALKDIGARDSDWIQGLPNDMPSYDGTPREFRTRYCLFDFDLALRLPPDTSLRDCRISAANVDGWGTFWAHPLDVAQGEYEYNPFAFDVACLGNVILDEFYHVIPSIPLLIPLLDRMTTHVISQRFTAAQALCFWEEAVQSIPRTAWETPLPKRDSIAAPSIHDHWNNAPLGFAETWKMYRSPSVPLMTRFLRWICSLNSYRAKTVVRFIRYHLKL